MKTLIKTIVIILFTLLTYYLLEVSAPSILHKHVEGDNFAYADLEDMNKTGNVARGEELVMGAGACTGCHSIEVAGMSAPMDANMAAATYGVRPPDLSNAGIIFDPKFLANLIKNPAHALKVEHKFNAENGKEFPMVSFGGAGGDINQEVADMVAYLQSIATNKEAVSPKIAFEQACGRCHANRYASWTQLGERPTFKKEQDALQFQMNLLDYEDSLKGYLGKLPPDLSTMIRARSAHYVETFVENPESYIKGTPMPRVGLTKDSMEKVIEYLLDTGDAKRKEIKTVGIYTMLFLINFTALVIVWRKQLWKKYLWKDEE